VLGSPDVLNLAVRAAFPELRAGWAGATATCCDRGLVGSTVVTRAGTRTPARSVLGLFAGTVFMGDEPRGFNTPPLLAFHVSEVEVRCFVDCSSRAARCPSAAEAVLYRHICDYTAATLVGEWGLSGQVPCLLALAVSDLPQRMTLQWNFDSH
jgi:hypothetical protein